MSLSAARTQVVIFSDRIVRKESKKKKQRRPYLCTQGHTPLSAIQYKVLFLPKGLFLFTHFSDSKGCSEEFPELSLHFMQKQRRSCTVHVFICVYRSLSTTLGKGLGKNIKEENGEIGKHKLNETAALNMK